MRAHATVTQTRPVGAQADCIRGQACAGHKKSNQVIQARLRVGSQDDPLERQADHAAERVVAGHFAGPLGSVSAAPQRTCVACAGEDKETVHRQTDEQGEEGELQLKADSGGSSSTGAESIATAVSHGGVPLPAKLRNYFEPRFATDLSTVRLHTHDAAASAAGSINACAFTLGNNIGFAHGEFSPGSGAGRKLIAHELAHTVQQAGGEAGFVRRQETAPTTGNQREEETAEEDAGNIIFEGLQTVASQAMDNNPALKKEVIEPLEAEAEQRWERLPTGEQALIAGFSAGTYAMTLAALLTDPGGRKLLSGVNLAAPLNLIPYWPLTRFSYTLPTAEEGPERLLRFTTKFSGDELLDAVRERRPGFPPMSLGVQMDWGYDPGTDRLTVLGGRATFGILKGITLSVGTFMRPPVLPEFNRSPGGTLVETRQRLPAAPTGPVMPGFQVGLSVDLFKLDRSFLPRFMRTALEAF